MQLYTRKQILKATQVNKATFWKYQKKGLIPSPSVKIGENYFYSQEEHDVIVVFWAAWKPRKGALPKKVVVEFSRPVATLEDLQRRVEALEAKGLE